MPFKDYSEFAREPITLPVSGRTYTLPPIGAKLGILLLSSINGDAHASARLGTSTSLWQRILGCTDECLAGDLEEPCGSVYDRMLADNVPLDVVGRAGFTALADFQYDRETAERVWESELDPEARAALAAAQRELQRMNSTNSPSTDEDAVTPSPAITSGTSSPPATQPQSSRASRSSGSRSSRSKG